MEIMQIESFHFGKFIDNETMIIKNKKRNVMNKGVAMIICKFVRKFYWAIFHEACRIKWQRKT